MNKRLGENDDLKWLEASSILDTRLSQKRFNRLHAEEYVSTLFHKFGPGKQLTEGCTKHQLLAGAISFLQDESTPDINVVTGWGESECGKIVPAYVTMTENPGFGAIGKNRQMFGFFGLNILKIIPSNANVESLFSIYNTAKSKLRTTLLQMHTKPYLVGSSPKLLKPFSEVTNINTPTKI